MRVLIADDSKAVRTHLVDMLGAEDCIQIVGETETVARTLASVRTLRPEAVVLDIQMPDGNGITALKEIKRDFPETDVIMLTNNANPFYRNTCLREGATFFFDKSTEFEKIGEVLRQLQNRPRRSA